MSATTAMVRVVLERVVGQHHDRESDERCRERGGEGIGSRERRANTGHAADREPRDQRGEPDDPLFEQCQHVLVVRPVGRELRRRRESPRRGAAHRRHGRGLDADADDQVLGAGGDDRQGEAPVVGPSRERASANDPLLEERVRLETRKQEGHAQDDDEQRDDDPSGSQERRARDDQVNAGRDHEPHNRRAREGRGDRGQRDRHAHDAGDASPPSPFAQHR
jgi:hypothetical protein